MDTYVCMKYRWIGDIELPEPWEPYFAAKRAVLYRPMTVFCSKSLYYVGPMDCALLTSLLFHLFIYLDSVLRDAVR